MAHTMTDDDLMPWGKYSKPPDGPKKMKDVPASYILYMYGKIRPIAYNKMFLSQKHFVGYVEDNKEVLEKQAKEEKGAR